MDYLEQRDIFYNDLLEEEMTSRRVIATVYAFAKMKKDNPIEAIRQENL